MKTTFPRFSRSGSALIITLAFIVMLTLLVAAMAMSMRIDRPAAASYFEKNRASLYAQEGVDRVVASLRHYSADPERFWVTRPGELVVGSETDNPSTPVDERKVLGTVVSLSSGLPSATPPSDPILQAPNLNVTTLRDPSTGLITDLPDAANPAQRAVMAIRWIYVRKSGALDTAEQPELNNADDPLVGRFAYWTDDESSKINYNIAWGRSADNTNPAGHPSRIELTTLSQFNQTTADAVRSFIMSGNATQTGAALMKLPVPPLDYSFFNTPEDARRVSPDVATALKRSKFEVTHFNHDPDTTFFNEPRIVLTTRPDRAGWTYNTNPAYPNKWVGVNKLPWPQGRPFYIRILANEGTVVQPNYVPKLLTPPAVDPLDPGVLKNIDAPNLDGSGTGTNARCKLTDTILMLALAPPSWPGMPAGFQAGYMQRNDWPMITGSSSIQDKYFGATGANYPNVTMPNGANVRTDRLAQMAIDIIEYVRAKESPQPIVPPIRASFSPTVTDPQAWFRYGITADDNAFMGTSRSPRITELGMWLGAAPTTVPQTTLPGTRSTLPGYTAPIVAGTPVKRVKVELYLPVNYGISQVDLTTLDMLDTVVATPMRIDPTEIVNPAAPALSDPEHSILKAGNYVTIVRNYVTVSPITGPGRVKQIGYRVALAGSSQLPVGNAIRGIRLDVAPISSTGSYMVQLPLDPEAVPDSNMSSVEVDDPRVNRHYKDWKPFSTLTTPVYSNQNTFGAANSISSLKTPNSPTVSASQPQQDTDSSGKISTISLYMPPPAGTSFTRADGTKDDNTKGMVVSPGELGYISTGVESCPRVTDTGGTTYAVPAGVPWRTLRFQPSKAATTVVPDWAFMDLFSPPVLAPDQNARYVYSPRNNSVGGRVNINAKVEPFNLVRTSPLTAVLLNATYDASQPSGKLSASNAQSISANIFNRTLATSGKQYGYSTGYDSPGEIVEIKGVADGGEQSEELVRSISNLITTRGDVFSVYTVGQSLKQTPDGKLLVTGEQRLQSMIERYTEAGSASGAAPATVNFVPVYFRNLTP
ncbi:hypothetical protein DB346_16920 [Verrucomicrobia bacterium LW23]|nr:hypothetical protein DB346_16920 [Verrucomicrobia bacterium LW23]